MTSKRNMETFKINRQLRVRKELLSWLWSFILVAAISMVLSQLTSWKSGNALNVFIIVFLFNLSHLLFSYQVTEVRLDRTRQELIFVLSSIYTGPDSKVYTLQEVSAAEISHAKALGGLNEPVSLSVYLPKKKIFRITGRYGFSADTLKNIEKAIIEAKGIQAPQIV